MPSFSEAQVNESFFHHEALGIAVEAERVLLETHHLDEQRYVEPVALVSKQRVAEAFQEFMNLEAQKPDGAERFIAKFGAFDYLEVKKNRFVGRGIPTELQQFCSQSVRRWESPIAVSLRDFWRVRDDILGLWKLGAALSDRNVTAARDECIRRRPNSTFDRKSPWLAVGKAILCTDLSASLNPGRRNPRLVLTERDGKLVALTMGTTVRASLYVTLLDMIVSKTDYRRCANCRNHFIVSGRHEKLFCTDACRNAAKVRRWRDRHKRMKEN
jgi:hypothetical protein